MSIIHIDGSQGGGSMLRQALGLSMLTQQPFIIDNIRANRPKPGLSAQHLMSLHLAQSLCNAQVRGNHIGATTVTFAPGPITKNKMSIDIGTAGSITLLLQTILLPFALSKRKLKIEVIGGTDVEWSSPIDYFAHVFLPQIKKFADVSCKIEKRGYYPKGGGKVLFTIVGKGLRPMIHLTRQGDLFKIWGVSHSSRELEKSSVSTRQADAARIVLSQLKTPIEIQSSYSSTDSFGSGITLWALFGDRDGINQLNPVILGGSCLGQRELRSEQVGTNAALTLKEVIASNTPCDQFLADQLVPFLSIVGGEISTSKITNHILRNIEVVKQFVDTDISIDGLSISASPQALPTED